MKNANCHLLSIQCCIVAHDAALYEDASNNELWQGIRIVLELGFLVLAAAQTQRSN